MNEQTTSPPSPHPISIEMFSRKTNKTTQLINNTVDESVVDGKSRWFEFSFESPVFIQEISVQSTGYADWNQIEFEVNNLDGTNHIEKVSVGNGESLLGIGKLANGFKFRPDSRWFPATPKIAKVIVIGLTLEEFHAYEWAVKDYDKRERAIKKLEESVAELSGQQDELQSKKVSLETEIGKSTAQLDALRKDVEAQKAALSENQSAQADLKRDIEDKRAARRDLQSEISDAETKLESITREVRLFPSEIAGFVKEGNRSIIQYICLSTPFVFILGYVTYALFSSAIDLTQLWRKQEEIDIWTVFLSRIPFVLVAITILEVSGYIIGRFVFEILRINRQRLSLSRLSIIAKDVSTASSHLLELSPEDAFDKETKLKMELLREHMKEDIGEGFTYKGTAIQSAVKAVVDTVAKSKSTGG